MAKFLLKFMVVLASVTLIVSAIFGYFNSANTRDQQRDPTVAGIYNNTITFVGDKYYNQIAPIGTAFVTIWPIIYTWNAAGIIYMVVSLFLPQNKSPVETEPTLIPFHLLFTHIVTFAILIGWLFAFAAQMLDLSLALLVIALITVYLTIGFSYKRTYDNRNELEEKSKVMLWLVRILFQNGLCILATWLTIATLINLVDVIVYFNSPSSEIALLRDTLNPEDGSTVGLSLLLVFIITWYILENLVWEKYCRFNLTIYPVLILGLSGVAAKLQLRQDANRNLILASVELGLCVIAFLTRVVLLIYKLKVRNHLTVV